MRVLHVISDENIGGAGVLLCTLLRHFDRDRVESFVALPRGSALCERIEAMNFPILALDHPCDRLSLASVREISSIIRKEKIELVHANAALCARIAAKRCGVPVVHTRHCCFAPTRWQKMLGVCNRALSDCVIATADAAAENLLLLGIPRERIETVINGSEPIREVGEDELLSLRARYSIQPDDFVIGIVARLEDCKGHDTLLRAAKLLLRRDPHYRFLIVGDGSRRLELEAMAEELGVGERVIFTGFVRDMAPIYRLLRVNVNCSRGTETSCLALSEGMSAGVPTVVSDYGGNAAMIGESDAGIVYPVDDALALADAIRSIASDPWREQRMRQAAHARYLECYTPARMTDRVTQIYTRVIQEKGSP